MSPEEVSQSSAWPCPSRVTANVDSGQLPSMTTIALLVSALRSEDCDGSSFTIEPVVASDFEPDL